MANISEQEVVVELTKLDDEIDHIVCCVDEDLFLCGESGSGMEWIDGHEATPCQTCEDRWSQNLCPKGFICVPYVIEGNELN